MKKFFLVVSAALTISFLSNNLFAQTAAAPAAAPTGDVVATISSNSDYNVMGVLIRAANLQATLRGAGPYTIFAPANTAFANLSAGRLDSLMADPVKLATFVKGHVVAGKFDKAAIIKSLQTKTSFTTLDGKAINLSVNDKKHLELAGADGDKAQVIAFDMLGTNGVVIGVDGVLAK